MLDSIYQQFEKGVDFDILEFSTHQWSSYSMNKNLEN